MRGFLIIALLNISVIGFSQIHYEEDFTSNPNFTILSPNHTFWDSINGNFWIETFDNLNEQYWAYSPQFNAVDIANDFQVSFDILIEYNDWGTYPGIGFYNNNPDTIWSTGESFSIKYVWANSVQKKFQITTKNSIGGVAAVNTQNSYAENVWYRFEIAYHSSTQTADITIKDLDQDTIFETLNNLNFDIQQFSYFACGFYDQPNYGDEWSPIRIDNILVSESNCYTNTFTSNPNFTILSPNHTFWDSINGNFWIETFDNLNEQYWAYSPQFNTVDIANDFQVSFDILIEHNDWGTYPGIGFYNNNPDTIWSTGESFSIKYVWANSVQKKFQITTKNSIGGVAAVNTQNSYAENVWYRFEIAYHSSTQTADITIKDLDQDTIFETLNNLNFDIQQFSYFACGFYDQPNYGDEWSPIRIDNILVSGQCSPITSLPSILAKESLIQMYPNPANNQLNIGSKRGLIYDIQVFDFYGKKVMDWKGHSKKVVLGLEELKSGVYFILVDTSEKGQYVNKFIKIE